MAFNFEGKRIILTGAARGIGGAAAEFLAEHGAHVVILDILDKEGKELAEKITATGPGDAKYQHTDVTKREEVFNNVDQAAKDLGGLDCIVNVAGVALQKSAEETTEEEWDWVYAIHVKGTLFMCQAALPHFKANGGGSIVNVASDAGIVGVPLTSHYGSAKAAVIQMGRTMAQEWGKHWVRINTINPAAETPMDQQARGSLSEEAQAAHAAMLKKVCPLGGKMGDAKRDIAPVIAFLAADASRFVTGQLIPVNGGMSAVR